MLELVGKKFVISGMSIEIVAEQGEQYQAQNLTTHETVFINKQLLEQAIKLGKAEEIAVKN